MTVYRSRADAFREICETKGEPTPPKEKVEIKEWAVVRLPGLDRLECAGRARLPRRRRTDGNADSYKQTRRNEENLSQEN